MSGHFVNLSQWVHASDEELESLVEQAGFGNLVPGRDLPPLRARLLRLERERGITEVHRRVSEKVLDAGARLVEAPLYTGTQSAFALSPSGRHLAIVSDLVGEPGRIDLRIWELATGRVVDVIRFGKKAWGVGAGWREPSRLQWSPSGEWLGVVFDSVVVGVLRAFAGTRPSFTVDVTRRWGSPPPWAFKRPQDAVNRGHQPAWCWSPDGMHLFVSTPGPDKALGCIVPFSEGAAVNEDSGEVRWCPARLGAERSNLSPHTWVRWSSHGSRVYGYCDKQYDSDEPFEEPHESISAIDVQNGNLQFRFDGVKPPVAFSPDGALLAYGRERLELADGHTGQTIATLSEQLDVSEQLDEGEQNDVSELVWSRDGRRLAVFINDYYRPAVCVFEAGKLLCRLEIETLAVPSSHGDMRRWAWSPDGSMGACLLRRGGVELWAMGPAPGLLRRLEGVGNLEGLAWGEDDTLVGMGPYDIAFWDVTSGHLRSHASFAFEPGRVPPPDAWNPWPDEPAQFIPTERGWAFTRVHPDGTVVCPPGARERLAPRLTFSVAGGHAWPWSWAVGTRHTRVEDPFAERRIPVPEGETAEARDARLEKWEQSQAPAHPISHYRADPVFKRGPAICRDNLAPYVGRVMLLRFVEHAFWYAIASLLEVTEEGILLSPNVRLSPARDRLLPFSMIDWIGPAVPLTRGTG